MQNNKNIFFGLIIFVAGSLFGGGAYVAYFKKSKIQNNPIQETIQEIVTSVPSTIPVMPPCPIMQAPDGSMVPVCPVAIGLPPDMANMRIEEINPVEILNRNTSPLLSFGTGTTTMKKATPWNDILIAESGSPFASLRNARYTMWPYPGEVALKETYIILPDTYDPIFPGYSDKQFIESTDGTKHIMIYLRHKKSTDVGADAKIFIQSPATTSAQDQRLTLFESTNNEAYFSIVTRGQEVIVEVSFTISPNMSPELLALARKELLHAVENMEIIW
ncbi:MAG: hypothetical protein Q7S11_03325 [bacterium]|nr:hypothetical protein [bacterium]